MDTEDGKPDDEFIFENNGAENADDNAGKTGAFSPGWLLLADSEGGNFSETEETTGREDGEENGGSLDLLDTKVDDFMLVA